VRFHFVREKIANKELEVTFVPSSDQKADILTKPLHMAKHKEMCEKLGLTTARERIKQAVGGMMMTSLFLSTLLIFGMVVVVRGITTVSNQPILWRPSSTPVTSGHNEFHLIVKFKSPCDVITNETVHQDLMEEALSCGKKMYDEYFIQELQQMCPTGHFTLVERRKKRFVITGTVLAVLSVAIVAAVGLGVAATAVATTNALQTRDLSTQLRDDERKAEEMAKELDLSNKATAILQQRMGTVEKGFRTHIDDYNEFKFKGPASSYAISFITTRLLMVNLVTKETTRQWKEKKLHHPFFDLLNFTLPCGDSCPLKYAHAKRCRLSYDKSMMYMVFSTPVINETLRVVDADAFDLMHQTENMTCTIKYTGPQNAIISTVDDCVYSVNIRHSNLILAPSRECQAVSALPDTSKYYSLDNRQQMQPHDAWDFVQVKPYHQQNHIYCAGSNITIGRVMERCPNQTFVLPENADFTINNHYYRVKEFRVNHQEVIDPLFTLRANWYLQPKIHMDEIVGTIPRNYPTTSGKEEEKNSTWFLVGMIIMIIFMMMMVFVGVTVYVMKKRSSTGSATVTSPQDPIHLEI
jgi:hypothetical protein